eukprot:TRINITY_DN9535_c0_g1_i1.p1 TRINITY_DN9535_c0_g1~~TRINITY_DN9535_c0_g1_i1.p1  ORF type:complete len:92 (+),score=0.37 TRINITY_DN9535_c0_g1_i1:463-738(+)
MTNIFGFTWLFSKSEEVCQKLKKTYPPTTPTHSKPPFLKVKTHIVNHTHAPFISAQKNLFKGGRGDTMNSPCICATVSNIVRNHLHFVESN